ncbi:MAG: IS1634 family transposase [Sphingobacteriia bacterium]|nr:IS1634 family transposase [Sphingobacteriia bacterium]
MAIVKQLDKRSGITYAYESVSRWDKDKKQSRSSRRLIGRVDSATDEIIATDGRCRKDLASNETAVRVKRGRKPTLTVRRQFFGATYLLDRIGKKIGIVEDLKSCFPDSYKMILSISYYLILEQDSPLFRFGRWGQLHRHPFGEDIASQRSSELFASITEEQKQAFFRLQGRRRAKDEYWAYDATSISSYSESLRQLRFGKNKDGDRLPQLNLLLLFGEKSNLPFYYRKLAGHVPDVKTLRVLLRDLDVLGYPKVKLVTDRGFYSQENINGLYQNHVKFLMSASTSLSFIKGAIESQKDHIMDWSHYSEKYDLYATTKSIAWDYSQVRPNKGDTLKEVRRMYLHLYFNADRSVEDARAFNKRMAMLHQELSAGMRKAEHEKEYEKYFELKKTPVRGIQIKARQEAMEQAKSRFGYFALLSNEIKSSEVALEIYRNKDVVEKAFGNIKQRLNGKRLLVSSEASLDGKLFVVFIALIFLSYLTKQMSEKNLYTKYTLQALLDEVDLIECFEEPGKALYIGEILQKQRQIFEAMGFNAPDVVSSL